MRSFAKCAVCGRPLTGSSSKGRNGRKYAYYSCNKYCRGVCIRKEALEAKFLELVQRLQPSPEVAALFRQIVLDVWQSKQGDRASLAAAQRRQLAMLEERMQRLLDAYIYDKAINRPTFQCQMDKLEEELANARLALDEAKGEGLDVENVLTFAEQVLTQPAKLWVGMSLDQRQRLQRVLFPRGIELTADQGIGTAGTCSVFNILQPESAGGSRVVAQVTAHAQQRTASADHQVVARARPAEVEKAGNRPS